MTRKRPQLAVVGAGRCNERLRQLAREVGAEAARAGALVLTGGRGGVMAAACEGAISAGGGTVGILPGAGPGETPPNESVEIAVFTGIGQARNLVLVLSAGAVIAIGGGWGTLSEIALALKHRVPVISLESWWPQRPGGEVEPLLTRVSDPQEAVAAALASAERHRRSTGEE